MFDAAYRTLLVMFCVLKFYFVDFYGMFTSSPTWRLKMHVLCKVGKNIIFQNKTWLAMFYRHNKTFWYQFWIFQHVLLAENSEDLASSCVEFSIGLSCNPVWDWVTIGTGVLYYWSVISANAMVTALLLSTVPGHHIGPPYVFEPTKNFVINFLFLNA